MPTPVQIANRRLLVYLIAAAGIISFLYVSFTRHSGYAVRGGLAPTADPLAYGDTPIHHVKVESDTLKGGSIAPKLGNETLK
jgi:hypothetical protein